MTAKLSESDSQPGPVSVSVSPSRNESQSAASWTHLIQSSVPVLGFLFEVTGKPWTAWLGVLGLVFAATIAGLLGLGGGGGGGGGRGRGMPSKYYENEYCKSVPSP